MTPIWLWIDTHAALVLTFTLGLGLFIAHFAGVALGWWEGMNPPATPDEHYDWTTDAPGLFRDDLAAWEREMEETT